MRTKLTDEASIRQVISELSLEEKMRFLIAVSACVSYSVEDMDIPSMVWEDGATGVNGTQVMLDFLAELITHMEENQGQSPASSDMGNPWTELQALLGMEEREAWEAAGDNPMKAGFLKFMKGRRNPEGSSVSFPSGVNIGACFSEETAWKAGRALGQEMRASGVDVCLGPNVDIMRDPLGGRNYEMYGEDPILVGRTAAAFIRGMQSVGTAACVKHFIANNQESRRQTKDTHVSDRTLRELYAKGFEAAVKDGKVRSVMSAYNAVNGVFSSYNKMILNDWLKEEWGFDGVVVSDWGAVTGHNDQAVAAGMDLVLHGQAPCDGGDIVEAVKSGTLPVQRVDDAVERILKLTLWVKKTRRENPLDYDRQAALQAAYDTVTDGMVLLKNDGILPLDKTKKTVFYGRRAKETFECGSGSTFVSTSLHTNVYEESLKLGAAVCWGELNGQEDCLEKIYDSDVVVYVAGAEGGENADRTDMETDREDKEQLPRILRAARGQGRRTVVVLNVAGPVDMRKWLSDADAVLVNFVPGCMGGKATADVMFGKAAPCGRLPVTFPVRLSDSPAAPYPTGECDDIYYSEGIFVGYRWYDCKELPTQFPFGYGLSYTTFGMKTVMIPEVWDVREQPYMEVKVRVKNTGAVRGAEVIQLYMGQKDARIPMPVKELKAFSKIYLEPGQEETVTLTVRREDLEVFDPERGLLLPIGEYRLILGTNSENSFYSGDLKVAGRNPYVMDENTTLAEIFESPEAMAVLAKYVPGVAAMPQEHVKLMGGEKIGPLLSRQLIRAIPDANELKSLLDKLFAELAGIE